MWNILFAFHFFFLVGFENEKTEKKPNQNNQPTAQQHEYKFQKSELFEEQ